jgi:peptidoglycan/LPS O-acetylase OafA/YrhL
MNLKTRIASIDILRILAIVFVVVFHAYYHISHDNSLRQLGFLGISLFFIISGFILAKNYPKLENFSFRWFFKRFVRIASLYYLALLTILILFSTQSYSGNIFLELGAHLLFLDPLFKSTAFGIISPAWFLTPLIALYILFPYINRYMRKDTRVLIIAFLFTFLLRFLNADIFSSINPLFYLAEFCFGIAFAYRKNHYNLLLPLFLIFISPIMAVPYLIFYLVYSLDIKSNKVTAWIGSNTLFFFLFHEAFINLSFGRWHILSFSKPLSLTILAIAALLALYISKEIQHRIINKSMIKKDRKLFTTAQPRINTVFFLAIIALVGFSIYSAFVFNENQATTDDYQVVKQMSPEPLRPSLIVSKVTAESEYSLGSKCYSNLNGYISNLGKTSITNVKLTCYPSTYPIKESQGEIITETIGLVNTNEKVFFKIPIAHDCSEEINYECIIE